jgi:hypothetical protein
VPKAAWFGVALGILVAASIVGCGDDVLSKEEYVSRLNAMCDDFSARERRIGDPQTLADLVEKGPRILDAFEEAIADKVHRLKAPDQIVDQADRLVEIAETQRDVLGAMVAAAKEDDVGQVQELASRNEALNRESASIARDLGAQACVGAT